MKKNILPFIASIFVCQMAGILGTIFTAPAIPLWYDALNKPFFNPPSWVFGPVWTVLYTLMGIALFLVWTQKVSKANQEKRKTALLIFSVQLTLNALWSPVFFGLQSLLMGFVIIVFMAVAILFTIFHFYRLSKTAALLLVPYFLWVSFATLLNFSLWQLNI